MYCIHQEHFSKRGLINLELEIPCADPGSSNFDNVLIFAFLGGREDPKTTISGPSSARQGNANIECWLGSFILFQGARTNIAKKPYIFKIVRGGGGLDPLPPTTLPLDPS